jgi:hypothetical protein
MTDRTITLFDRINLANCAAMRAGSLLQDEDRFHGEYETARAWTKYRVYNSTNCRFIEVN